MNGEVSHVAHEAFTGAGHVPGLQIWRIEVKPANPICTTEFYLECLRTSIRFPGRDGHKIILNNILIF